MWVYEHYCTFNTVIISFLNISIMIQIWLLLRQNGREQSHFGHLENEKEEETGLASAEEGEVALPAAHLAAHGGQYVINIPSGQLGAWVAAAQALQTGLLPCGQTWNIKTQ